MITNKLLNEMVKNIEEMSLIRTNIYKAWFSSTTAENYGFSVYLDEEGEEVRVTVISQKSEPTLVAHDLRYVGTVLGDKVLRHVEGKYLSMYTWK